MNTIIKQLYGLLAVLLFMGSCNSDPEYYTLDTPIDQMKIRASATELTLQKTDEAKEAVTFSWNRAADRGEGTGLVYYFRMYHTEMDSLKSDLIRLDEDQSSITWTVRQLNNLLSEWNIVPGERLTIEAEVIASVEVSSFYMKPEISKTQFSVSGYDDSNKLYLKTVANGQQRVLEMQHMGDGVYQWQGELDQCEYWFVRNKDQSFPAYTKGADDESLVYSPTGEGVHFTTPRLGAFTFTVDLNAQRLTMVMNPIYRLYLVTVKDGVESVRALEEAQFSTDIFYLKTSFEAGTQFRFVRDNEVLWPAYTKGADESSLQLNNEGAAMFQVTKTATYVLTVNMNDLSLIFLDVYVSPTGVIAVVGDALYNAAWDSGLAVVNSPLTQKDLINKPEVISYTGRFEWKASGSQNSFKFVGNGSWGHQIFAPRANANPFDSADQGTSFNNAGDNKWQIPSGTSGMYTLELNLHTMRINMFRQ